MQVRERDGREKSPLKQILKEAISKKGISFPDLPKSSLLAPRKWLIRAESDFDRLIYRTPFFPQDGQMGSRGVFFGDCWSCLMYPNPGIFYVFETSKLKQHWIAVGSAEYQQIIDHLLNISTLNMNTVGNGIEVESQFYTQHAVYEPNTGVATVNEVLSINSAALIVIPSGIPPDFDLEEIDNKIRRKLLVNNH